MFTGYQDIQIGDIWVIRPNLVPKKTCKVDGPGDEIRTIRIVEFIGEETTDSLYLLVDVLDCAHRKLTDTTINRSEVLKCFKRDSQCLPTKTQTVEQRLNGQTMRCKYWKRYSERRDKELAIQRDKIRRLKRKNKTLKMEIKILKA